MVRAYRPESFLHVSLQSATGNEAAVEELAVALLVPVQVVVVLPRRQAAEGLESLAQVLLHNAPEAVNAPLVHEVFQASLLAVVSAAVVTLCGHNRLDRMVDISLHTSRFHMFSQTRQSGHAKKYSFFVVQINIFSSLVTKTTKAGVRPESRSVATIVLNAYQTVHQGFVLSE